MSALARVMEEVECGMLVSGWPRLLSGKLMGGLDVGRRFDFAGCVAEQSAELLGRGCVVNPKMMFPPSEVWKLCHGRNNEFGVRELLSNIKELGLTVAELERYTLDLCPHGVRILRKDPSSQASSCKFTKLANIILSLDSEVEMCWSCGEANPWPPILSGYCYMRAFPSVYRSRALALGPSPDVVSILELAKTFGSDVYTEVADTVVSSDGKVAHVATIGQRGVVSAPSHALGDLPAGVLVAGDCGRLGYGSLCVPLCAVCSGPPVEVQVSSPKQMECPCKLRLASQDPVSFSGEEVLAMCGNEDVLIGLQWEGGDFEASCPGSKGLAENSFQRVGFHLGEQGEWTLDVRGSFLVAAFGAGVNVEAAKGVLVTGPVGVVIAATSMLSVVIRAEKEPAPVGVFCLSYASKLQWLHRYMHEDPANTFARFLPRVGASLVVGRLGRTPMGRLPWGSLPTGDRAKKKGRASRSSAGCSEYKLRGRSLVPMGQFGTCVIAGKTMLEVGPVRLYSQARVVFSRKFFSGRVVVDCTSSFKVIAGTDDYDLDNGGPSGSEGFYSEF